MKHDKVLYIIDGSSLIYRAFHAVPPTFVTSKGLPTNAVFGFTQSLRKIINDYKPAYIAIAYDVKGPTMRHEMFAAYKIDRPPMPDLLSVQIPYIKQMAACLGVASLEMSGFEADDIIATICKRTAKDGIKTAIITGDKDMYQLVGGGVVILDYLNNKEYGEAEVMEKFGVGAALIRDLLALAGDSSDGIPGVPGIGFKTAEKLIAEFGPLECIYENIDKVKGDKLKEKLRNNRDAAFMSRELATLHADVNLPFSLDDLAHKGPDFTRLEPLMNELEFRKLLKEMQVAAPVPVDVSDTPEFTTVDSIEGIAALTAALVGNRSVQTSITMLTEGDGFGAAIRAMGIHIPDKAAFYVLMEPIGSGVVASALKPWLTDSEARKTTDNSKSLYTFFISYGIDVKGVCMDTALASYLLDPSSTSHSVGALTEAYQNKRSSVEINDVNDINAAGIVIKKAMLISELSGILDSKLKEFSLFDLLQYMEIPLSRVLASMETLGIRIDDSLLREMSAEMDIEMNALEGRIYAAVGTEFNINSPKQLAEVLFERLKLKPLKKTKTGFSTDEEVLTKLAASHEVPQMIIGYRSLSKLKSTYVDALIEIMDPSTGRVHTSFNQTVTTTGRLSSSRPNLQNIPVKGAFAPRIRESFIPKDGFTFMSADYSQIELRLAAHMSNDPYLVDAFLKGDDIHTRTASEVFGVLPSLVSPDLRRRAKAINFGILYGMGPFGLASELGISVKEAENYITSYFNHYRGVKEFIDRTITEARVRGYTVTLLGRRRFIPELNSPVEAVVRLGQRLAINTPVQGTAADMIKAAMVKIDECMSEAALRSRMILQIHDELLFEVAEGEKEALSDMVRREMEGVVSLRVPIIVNMKSGRNWRMVE